MDHFDDEMREGRRLSFFYVGVVVDREDPENLGRVRVRIPGVMEPFSPWALPLGTGGGGSANRGLFTVPDVGAEVGVFFNQGDPKAPHYLTGNWGKPGGESEVPPQARNTYDNTVLATADFRVEVNQTEGERVLRLSNVRTGDVVELNADRNSILIAGTTSVQIQAVGEIALDASVITIGGRAVRVGVEDPI